MNENMQNADMNRDFKWMKHALTLALTWNKWSSIDYLPSMYYSNQNVAAFVSPLQTAFNQPDSQG